MPGWIEIRSEGPAASKDAAVAVFISAGSPGVLEESRQEAAGRLLSHSLWADETAEEPDSSPTAVLRAYLPEGEAATARALKKRLSVIGWKLATSFLKDADWSEKWKKGLRPVKVAFRGKSMVVAPTWLKAAKRPGQTIIRIDPGMAFGTGGHATTRMCLSAMLRLRMAKALPPRPTFLDIGTGTGVLAIAAGKLGFGRAVGIDVDAVALKVARQNARLNRARITISSRPVERVRERFTLVAANILAGELTRLSVPISGRVAPGGSLILSGILKAEQDAVVEAYSRDGLVLRNTMRSGEWAALVMSRPGTGAKR